MEKRIDFNHVIGAASGEHSNMLGKFLYFSLSNALVDKKELETLCENLGMDCSCGKRVPVTDAFKSATGDIRDRITVRRDGEQKFYQIYCRENQSTPSVLSRELVKETVNQRTNQYEKLANIHYDKGDQRFGYDDLTYDEDVDAMKYCLQAERLFELYQTCANRKQIETICLKYLRSLDVTKVSVNGHLYFVPRHAMEQVAVFETFFEELSRLNRNNTPLIANSFYLIDDAKQRDKMTEEFYLAVKKEIAQYQERADYFIRSGCSSPSTMERWVVKIQALGEKSAAMRTSCAGRSPGWMRNLNPCACFPRSCPCGPEGSERKKRRSAP